MFRLSRKNPSHWSEPCDLGSFCAFRKSHVDSPLHMQTQWFVWLSDLSRDQPAGFDYFWTLCGGRNENMTSDDDDIELTIKLLAWDPRSLCPPTCLFQGFSGVHLLRLDQIILSAVSINILPILDINILPVLSFSRACPQWGLLMPVLMPCLGELENY